MAVSVALPTAEQLARTFSRLLQEGIGHAATAEARRRNGEAAYDGCCASHDFCDANMTMLAALEEHGVDEDAVFENDCDNETQRLWNEAWDVARAQGFFL